MDDLPVELIELVVELLDFRDICALRLCSRDLHAKASQGRFHSFVHDDKRLPLTEDDLRTLVAVTEPRGLGGGLEQLVLVGVCDADNLPSEGNSLGDEQIELLTEAFRNINANSVTRKLGSLSLEVTVRLDGQYFPPTDAIGYDPMMMPGRVTGKGYPKGRAVKARAVWEASSRTFQTAMEALSLSELVVDELEIFTDVLHCSLACDRLARASAWPEFGQTRRLALSVSHNFKIRGRRENPGDDHESESECVDPDSQTTGEGNAQNIVRFLAAFPHLDELELQWYSIQTYDPPAGLLLEQNFLQQVNDHHIRWPDLKHCTLKGLRTKTEPLLAFFKHHPRLTDVALEGIRFPTDTDQSRSKSKVKRKPRQLQPVLNYFSRKGSRLEYFRLLDIWEHRQLVFRPAGVENGARTGEQARRRIVCAYPPDTGPSPAQIEDIWERAEESRRFGPP